MKVYMVICAWCNAHMHDGALPISHGMCDACSKRLNAEMDALKGTK